MSEHSSTPHGAPEDLDVRDIYKSKFLVGEDLDGREHECRITGAKLQPLPADDGEMEMRIKLKLAGFDKPLLLGKKEATKIGQLMGNPKARYWVGGSLVIYPMPGKFFGVQQVVPRVKRVTKPTQGGQRAAQPQRQSAPQRPRPNPDDDGRDPGPYDEPNPAG
jgi:hypothetical protein